MKDKLMPFLSAHTELKGKPRAAPKCEVETDSVEFVRLKQILFSVCLKTLFFSF